MKPRLLIVGPLPIAGDVVGGTKVSFAGLVHELEVADAVELRVHDISRPRAGRGRLRRAAGEARGLAQLALALAFGRHDAVLFNASSGGLLKSGPLAWLLCRTRRRPLAVRVFGGDLDLFLDRAPRFVRWLAARTFLRADQVWLQTRALVARFDAGDGRVRWWPTTRELAGRPPAATARRFLFLGQLRAEKGVAEALAAAHALPAGATLTVQGPPMPGFALDAADAGERVELRDAATPGDVPDVLAAHDVLVLPTYHPGEGLPGIVVEAMQVGLPVVATRWRSVPELVEDGVSGLLVNPREAGELATALRRLAGDAALFQRLAAGARLNGDRFRSSLWRATLDAWVRELVGLAAAPQAALADSPATPAVALPAPRVEAARALR